MPRNKFLFSFFCFFYYLKYKPDLLICGHINFLKLTKYLNYIFNSKHILQIHGIEAWDNIPDAKKALKTLDLVFSVSRYTRSKFLEWSKFNKFLIKVIPCTIDLSKFKRSDEKTLNKLRKNLNISSDQKILLTIGRLSSQEKYKGQDKIIDLLPKILKKENIIYLVVGNGDDLERLQKKVEKLDLFPFVRFANNVTNDNLGYYFDISDAFAMPSSGEGFGIVFLEAASKNLPILGGKVDGSYDALLEGKLGYIVDPSKKEDLEKGLLSILKESKKSKNDLLDGFSLPTFISQVVEQINFVMDEKR